MSLQSCPALCDPIDGSLPGSHPWDSPGKNTGVGCHFLLQRVKVKSESEVTQSCLTLRDSMDCSPPGSSVHGDFPGKSIGVGCHCLLRSRLLNPTISSILDEDEWNKNNGMFSFLTNYEKSSKFCLQNYIVQWRGWGLSGNLNHKKDRK